jgi:hypothetical protein
MKSIYILLCVSLLLTACGKDKSETQETKTSVKTEIFTVDTFTDLPAQIDGCSCTFSEDSVSYAENKYIYADDFVKTSFIKIDGKLIELTETEHSDPDSLTIVSKSTGGGYKVEIRATIIHTTDLEYNEMKGTITIRNAKQKTVTKKIYGVCGC